MGRETVTIGIDIGTSGAKGVLLAASGAVLARATAAYPLLTPRPGWTEQEPEAWWQATLAVLRNLAATANAHELAGIGLSGQMHGSVFLDAAGDPIRPALLVERRPHPCRVRRDRPAAGPRARHRDHRQPRQHRLPGAQAAVAAGERARGRGEAGQAPAAQGLHPAAADRRARHRRRRRLGHAVPRPAPPPLQRRDAGGPRCPGRACCHRCSRDPRSPAT